MSEAQNAVAEALAQKRFFMLNAIRISGAIFIGLGLAILANGFMDLPKIAGAAVFLIGIFAFIFVPFKLARAWKSKAD
jgi:hypothetical protein